MSSTRLIPSWSDLKRLRQPLTEGEETLIKILDAELPRAWEIYVQPYLNGDRPDIVVLHPLVGLCVIEVKDWASGLYSARAEHVMIGEKRISVRRYEVKTKNGARRVANPLKQAERYVENLISLYAPELAEAVREDKNVYGLYRSAVYMHKMTTPEARTLLKPRKNGVLVVGHDFLNNVGLASLVPNAYRNKNRLVTDGWADTVRRHLRPSFHAIEQGLPLHLTAEQKRHAVPAAGTHQRLRGVAGSGKTLVMAQRAAALAEQGHDVLVVYFNITLGAYIRDHISRARRNFSWEHIEIHHFHHLCKNFLLENDVDWPSRSGNRNQFFREEVPALVSKLLAAGRNRNNRYYDAVLIDEGQDFNRNYYQVLCGFLTPRDELLLVRDERQNIYNEDGTWTDADPRSTIKTRFRGQWRMLRDSFRMPRPLIPLAQEFAKRFLGDGRQEIHKAADSQLELELGVPHLIWRESASSEETLGSVERGALWLMNAKKIHPQDIVILTATHQEGIEIVKKLEHNHRFQVNHVFGLDDEDSRHQKRAFQMNDGRIKVSTIHSFKGWELINVLLVIPNDSEYNEVMDIDRLVYTAITRTRNNLIVYSRNTRYRDYGSLWPNSWNS